MWRNKQGGRNKKGKNTPEGKGGRAKDFFALHPGKKTREGR